MFFPARSNACLAKVHMSDPDIEAKAHDGVETTALITENHNVEKDSPVAPAAKPGAIGVLQDFWTTPFVK